MLKKLLILLLIPFILCACEKKTKEEITFSSWGSVTEVRIINKIISDFEHENPDIKVNFISWLISSKQETKIKTET